MVENLIIIGSGPAGFTAAIYAARAKLKPVLITGFEMGGIPGGQLMTTTFVENFPGFPNGVKGPELMDLMKSQALRCGAELIDADATKINLKKRPFVIHSDGSELKSNAIIIATGAKANRLNLPSEHLFWSKGISACAICDGATPQFHDESLAVVGGGDSACEEAVYLTKYGSNVHLIVRAFKLRANAQLADRVLTNPQITIHWGMEVIDIEGDHWLDKVKLKDRKSGLIKKLNVKGLFYAIGHTPNTELFRDQLNIDANGYLLTTPGRPETSIEGVFSAGDVSDFEWRQAITAASSGCKAALAAERWLSLNQMSVLMDNKNNSLIDIEDDLPAPISDESNFQFDAKWQKGSYALRKLYHESNKPLLVIYSSSECGPCHILKPQLRKIINQFDGQIQCVEIDIELENEIAIQANVIGTPTVHLFKDKVLKSQWRGVKQRSEYKKAISQIVN